MTAVVAIAAVLISYVSIMCSVLSIARHRRARGDHVSVRGLGNVTMIAGDNSVQAVIAGRNSTVIQSGRDITNITIAASNGGVAALNVGHVELTNRLPIPPVPPIPPIPPIAKIPSPWPSQRPFTLSQVTIVDGVVDLPLDLGGDDAGQVFMVESFGDRGPTACVWNGETFDLLPAAQPGISRVTKTPRELTQAAMFKSTPVQPFAAVSTCPACGDLQTHFLRPADQSGDPAGSTVVRECAACGQCWGQR